jgi:hypothetical protein
MILLCKYQQKLFLACKLFNLISLATTKKKCESENILTGVLIFSDSAKFSLVLC